MKLIRLLSSVAVLLVAYGCFSDRQKSIMPDGLVIKDGDVVFRRGTGVSSRIVTNADSEGIYSHVGIAVMTDSGMMIVHAVPDEPDFDGDVDRVKIERPHSFFASLKAKAGAVSRHPDPMVGAKAAQYALGAYLRNTLFDHEYNDDDTINLYCCQLITLAYHNAGIELTDADRHHYRIPGVIDTNCLFPSDIFNSEQLVKIAQFE